MSKSHNPGFQGGNNWLIDDLTGKARRKSETRKRWDGIVMDAADWEPRHPQDFVRSKKDKITPDGPIRPDIVGTDNQFEDVTYAASHSVPSGTFDGSL